LSAGSGLVGPEATLTLPPAASSTSKGETRQSILMLLMQLQAGMAGMAAEDQAWEMLPSQQNVCAQQAVDHEVVLLGL